MNPVVVVDLGTNKAAAVMASLSTSGKLEIHGMVTSNGRGMHRGTIQNIEEAARALDTCLRHLSQETHKQEIVRIAITVSGAAVEGTNVQGFKPIIPANRTITNQDVMEVVNHSKSGLFPPDRVQIQTIPREFGVDEKRHIHQPVGMTGSKLDVMSYIVTGKTAHIEAFRSVVQMHGRQITEFIYSPLASGIGVIQPGELSDGAVVVDIGGSKTDVAIFSNGSLGQGFCIPIGGNLVSSDLSKLLNMSPEEADRVKRAFGSSKSEGIHERDAIEIRQLGQAQARPMQRRVLCEIIESRMTELAHLVKRSIEKAGYWGTLPGGVILTGGGAQLLRTDELFSDVLAGMPVRVAEPQVKGTRDHVGIANVIGAAQFILQTQDELYTISGGTSWQDRVKGIWGLFSGNK